MTSAAEKEPLLRGAGGAPSAPDLGRPPSAVRRVLHVAPSFAPAWVYGGPIYNLASLTKTLSAEGVDVRVLTTDANGADRLAGAGRWQNWGEVPVYRARRYAQPDVAPQLAFEALSWAAWADVVHVTAIYNLTALIGLLAAVGRARPLVVSTRGALQPNALNHRAALKRTWLRLASPVFERVSAFHATAEHEADAIRAAFGTRIPIHIIPNGVDLEPSQEAPALRGPRPAGKIGMLGRIHPIKAIDRVIEALALLEAQGISAELIVAGPTEDEVYLQALRTLARRLGVDQRVHWVGSVAGDAKRAFLVDLDVLAVASHSENFGNVVVEALAAGVPVVASRGTPWAPLKAEAVGDWVENSPAELAAALVPWLTDRQLNVEAGKRGRALVERDYTWASVGVRTLAMYDSVLTGNAHSAC